MLRAVAKIVLFKKRALLRVILLIVILPSLIADGRTEKSFSRRTMSAVFLAESAPSPIDIPQEASFRARTSLTPSPVIATTLPEDLRFLIKVRFCSGVTRAKISKLVVRDFGKVFDFRVERSTEFPRFRPRDLTTFSIVPRLSPEIIFTFTSFF